MPCVSSASPARKVLGGVPAVSRETHYFIGALAACMQYMKPDAGFDYAYLDGMSGAAFGITWKDMRAMADDITNYPPDWNEPVVRALAACGFAADPRSAPEGVADVDFLRAEARKAVDAGLPLLARCPWGIPVFAAVAGYDGDAVVGTTFFQHFFSGVERDKEYPHLVVWRFGNMPDWVRAMTATFTRPVDLPSERERYADALAFAAKVARMAHLPNRPDIRMGRAAYDAWAADLLNDDFFPERDENAWAASLDANGGGLTTMVGRDWAGAFLRRAAKALPEAADELEKAAALHVRIMEDATKKFYGPDVSPETARTFALRETRESNAKILRQARDWDAEAAEWIDRALAKIG